MIIANHQTLDRICATAGSELYRARRLTDGMAVLLKRHRPEHASAAQSVGFRSEYRLLQRGCLTMPLEDFAGESLEAVLGRDLRMDLPVCLVSPAMPGGDQQRVMVTNRAYNAGADEVLKKPLSARELAASLARVLHP
jgi:FixJ family two-component response regulator